MKPMESPRLGEVWSVVFDPIKGHERGVSDTLWFYRTTFSIERRMGFVLLFQSRVRTRTSPLMSQSIRQEAESRRSRSSCASKRNR